MSTRQTEATRPKQHGVHRRARRTLSVLSREADRQNELSASTWSAETTSLWAPVRKQIKKESAAEEKGQGGGGSSAA